MSRKVILAGGRGFLGQALARRLGENNWDVVVLSRRESQFHQTGDTFGRVLTWDAVTVGDWAEELDGSEAVVNFAGRSINAAPTDANRRAIRDSRVASVRVLGAAVAQAARPPRAWLQCSGIGYYGPRSAIERCDEATPAGNDFLASVCKDWEAAFLAACPRETRGIIFRLGVVLGRNGGAFPLLARLARVGLGGTAGSGGQGMSWVHLDDVVSMFARALENPDMSGAYNACAPEPVSNAEFMRTLRRAAGRPWSPPAPAFAVRLVARYLMRTNPDLILTGQFAVPARLQGGGYKFIHPQPTGALRALFAAPRPG